MSSKTRKDTLGDRMKSYERQYASQKLLPLIPMCARMDGKAFHSFTRGLRRPYDERLSNLMIETTKHLVSESGARIGYTQSDEISLVWYAESLDTMLFFDSKLLKMTSILASMASVYFNRRLAEFLPEKSTKSPLFDARVWNVPTLNEAALYLLWREHDATRNSVSMAAQSCYSHKSLHGASSAAKMDMLMAKGINWNDYPAFFRRGTYVSRKLVDRPFTAEEVELLPPQHEARFNQNLVVTRTAVDVLDLPPITRVGNKVDALFFGKAPIAKTEGEGL